MKIHAGTATCPDCGKRREVEYDLESEETTCKHCGEVIVPKAAHLSQRDRARLALWWEKHPLVALDR